MFLHETRISKLVKLLIFNGCCMLYFCHHTQHSRAIVL